MFTEELNTLFYTIIDVIIYIFAVTAIVFVFYQELDNTYTVARNERYNTTIVQTDGEPESKMGYTDYMNNKIYEGTLTGSQVYNDILSIDTESNLLVEINGYNTGLTMDDIERYQLTESGRKTLSSKINLNGNYIREYTVFADGSLYSVNYVSY